MAIAKSGDTVKVHYTGKLEDGSIFDSSVEREPIEFTLGTGKVIPGFEKAVEGMELNETKTFTIEPEEAYGPYYEEMVQKVPIEQVPNNIELEIGQHLRITKNDGNEINVTVKDKDDASVTLDANHPLAGQNLTFEIKLVEIA